MPYLIWKDPFKGETMLMTKVSSLMGWPLTLSYVLLWLAALYFALIVIPKTFKTSYWIETQAHITANKLIKTQRTHSRTNKQITVFSAKVSYEYLVDGNQHSGATQKLAEREKDGEKIHKAMQSQYPIGNTISVYYNPKNPIESVTETGFTALHWIIAGFLLLSIAWLSLLITQALKG